MKTASRNRLLALLLAISPMFGVTVVCAADALPGRLFFSAQKRAILDDLRTHDSHIAATQEADTVALNGIVRRSSGKATIWINGQPYLDRYPVAQLGQNSARIFLGNGKTAELKVGQQMTLMPTSSDDSALSQ